MNCPRLVRELLAAWSRGLPFDESQGLEVLLRHINWTLEAARSAPASLDRRCMENCQTKLEEAEHWALAAMRVAVNRADHECPPSL